jgi:hypothetical protein
MSTTSTPRAGSPTGSQCYETYTYEEVTDDVEGQEIASVLLLPEKVQELAAIGNSSQTLLNLLTTIRTIMGFALDKSDPRPTVQAAYCAMLQELADKTEQLSTPTHPRETQEIRGLLQELIPLFHSNFPHNPSMKLQLMKLQQADQAAQNLNVLAARTLSHKDATQTLQNPSEKTIGARWNIAHEVGITDNVGGQEISSVLLLPEKVQELAAIGNSSQTLLNLLTTIRTIMRFALDKSDPGPTVQAAYCAMLQELVDKTKQLSTPTHPRETQEIRGLLQDLIPLFHSNFPHNPSMKLQLMKLQQADHAAQNLKLDLDVEVVQMTQENAQIQRGKIQAIASARRNMPH